MKKILYILIAGLCLIPYGVWGLELEDTSYTIEYYYDNILDESQTITEKGKVGDLIIQYPEKKKENYELFYSTIDDEGLTLSEKKEYNEIKVFYTKIGTNNGNMIPPKTGIQEKGANVILPSVLIVALILARKKLKN